jgi:hypothetical protein
MAANPSTEIGWCLARLLIRQNVITEPALASTPGFLKYQSTDGSYRQVHPLH